MSDPSSSSSGEMSPNRRALEAITAYIQGRATAQQREVVIGDKKISYSSLDELLNWKRYFEEEVRKEEGKHSNLRLEKLYWGMRRV